MGYNSTQILQFHLQKTSHHNSLGKNVIIWIYNISYEMWINRNKEVHDEVEERMDKREAEKLQQEITDEYNKDWLNIMILHRYLLEELLENVYGKTVNEKLLVTNNSSKLQVLWNMCINEQ